MIEYIDWVLTPWSVGVYSPVGVDNAMLMSAFGRTVSVGFDSSDTGVMEERNMGHSSIAFESVFRNMGRYVRRVYCWDSGAGAGEGAG